MLDRCLLVDLLRHTLVELVRDEQTDLSARQLSIFLICYTKTDEQTVRGLAAELCVSKPAVTRALDRLAEFYLIRRRTDPLDRRSVLVQRTKAGAAFLTKVREILAEAAERSKAKIAPQG